MRGSNISNIYLTFRSEGVPSILAGLGAGSTVKDRREGCDAAFPAAEPID
jgi:hypothetical protein